MKDRDTTFIQDKSGRIHHNMLLPRPVCFLDQKIFGRNSLKSLLYLNENTEKKCNMGQRKKSEKNQFLMTKPQRHNEIRYEGKFNIFSSSQKIT